jgi:glycogen debranching enzyme
MNKTRADKIKKDSLAILEANRRTKNGFQYTVPSPESYPYQWLWDSCFHAIILAHYSPIDAKKEIYSLLAKQFDNGLIPHMIYWDRVEGIIDLAWGKNDTSSITQPPIIAYAAWEIYRTDKEKAFLERIYPNLYHYYKYLLSDRDPRGNNLAGIINPDESGEDNSPRFDLIQNLPPRHLQKENFAKRLELIEKNKTCDFDAPFCMKQFFWVKDVPFNAVLVRNLNILGLIAEEIGRMDEALYFRDRAIRVADAMRDRMFQNGLFWSLNGRDYSRIDVKTWAIFTPMFAHLLSQDEANDLVEKWLRNPNEFGSRYSVPTVAMSEPSYDPDGFWRGPVWLATNWFIFKGLRGYGFNEDAERILEHSIALIEKSGFRENFNPDSGEGQGAHNFTWGALVVDMLAEYESG